MLEQMIVGAIGPHAALNVFERPLIVPPAGRMLARMDGDQLGRYAAFMDPAMLGLGVCVWGFRVWSQSRPVPNSQADRAGGGAGTAATPDGRPGPGEPSAAAPPADASESRAPNGVAPAPFAIAAYVESDRVEGF